MVLPLSAIPPLPRENEPTAAARESADTLRLLAQRRSTKIARLAEPGPTGAEIDALIALAGRVPDHGKIGPWRFVVMEGEARARAGAAIARVIEKDEGVDETRLSFARSHFLRAPLCVMVVSTASPHPKIPEWEQMLSSAAVCFSLLLSAHALGYAGCWLTEWPAYDGRVRTALGLGEHERIAGFIYLGSTREPSLERVRVEIAPRIQRF
jgi:nitroreductase